jgi:formamidopyrimidine-DNA glycosylase
MPELPEVETVVRGLRPILVGRRFDSVVARRADLRWPLPPDLAPRLEGASVSAVRRRAKYGLVDTDRGDTLLFHLGMSGRFRLSDGPVGRHDHVLFTIGGRTLALTDPRRFGSLDLVPTADAARHPRLAALGAEPLAPGLGAVLAAAAAGRRAPIKAVLLDQRVIAGIGNIYAAEALFEAGIAPDRAAGRIGPHGLAKLAAAIPVVLEAAIAAGGSTLRDHARPDGLSGRFQHGFRVYGRAGLACPRCAAPVRVTRQSGRSSFHCPRCQR